MPACVALVLAMLFVMAPAHAWYFPEHVVLTEDGDATVPPEVRAILSAALRDAHAEGLSVCEDADARLETALRAVPLATPRIRIPESVACVPYAALPGLAGDHASDVAELRAVLTSRMGVELMSAVAYEWRHFKQAAQRGPRALDRMSFVHELDVALYFLDPGYVRRARATRGHFRDLDRSFDTVLRDLARDGRIDEVVARFVFHHARSLVLARLGRRTDALLDHAFALHFLQDAFASGHLVMGGASWAAGRDAVRFRHDAFNADGLPVRRALAQEPCAALADNPMEVAGVTPCWTTSGDGYLSLDADASDRLHAAAAMGRAEIAFAMALDPARVVAYANGLGDLEIVSFATKLDPSPWWTVDAKARRALPAGPAHAHAIVSGAAAAAGRLTELTLPEAAGVDTPREAGAVDPGIIAGVLDPVPPLPTQSAGAAVGVALLRPTLAQLPTAQDNPTALRPEGHLDHGWAIQLTAGAGAFVVVPPRSPVDVVVPSVSVAGGFSYRWGTLLPGRRARAISELNVGASQALHVDTAGHSGGSVLLTMLDQELRWPVLWEGLTQYNLPLDVASLESAGRLLFLSGVRSHEVVRSGQVSFLGVELEVAALALSNGHGSHPLYVLSPELRFYVGLADPRATQPSFPSALGPSFGLTLSGGYASQVW